jgi:hypothetical protein
MYTAGRLPAPPPGTIDFVLVLGFASSGKLSFFLQLKVP